MLRLFKLVVDGEPVYFDSKRLAKRKRAELAGLPEDKGQVLGLTIMRGPDHRKGESFNDG